MLSALLGGATANVGALQKKKQDQINKATRIADLLVGTYYQQKADGAFDPNQKLEFLAKAHQYSTKVESANAAASAKIMGYRPGDSEPGVAQHAMSEKAGLDYEKMALDVKDQAAKDQQQAVGGLGGQAAGIYQNNAQSYDNSIQTAIQQNQQQQAGLGNLLGVGMQFLAPQAAGAKAIIGGIQQGKTYTRPGQFAIHG